MDVDLATAFESHFGLQVRRDGAWIHALIEADGGFFNARVRNDPVAELFVTPCKLDGFELVLRGERMRADATFETALNASTNDHELARLWFDAPARQQVLDSAYEYHLSESYLEGLAPDELFRGTPVRRIWTYELAHDELIATKGTFEGQPEQFVLALVTACTIAARPRRWALEYAELARRLGAECRTEVELGGAPVVTTARGTTEVSLSLVRRLPGERTGRLRTLITSRRVGLHDERTFSLIDRSASRTMIPPLPEGDRRGFGVEDYRLRASSEVELDELATKQLVAARPSVVVADADSIDVWFDGAPTDLDRLQAAFALAGHLAVGNAAPQGPYR